jgi:hypothetical protein
MRKVFVVCTVGTDGYQKGLIDNVLWVFENKVDAQKARRKEAKDGDLPLAALQILEREMK